MLRVAITDAGVGEMLRRLSKKLSGSLRPVLSDIGVVIESRANIRRDTKTDPSGRPWAPWAKSTEKRRAREGRGTLLDYSGRMWSSLTSVADTRSVTIGFGVDYAAVHEFGTKSGTTPRIPARHMLLAPGSTPTNPRLSQSDLAAVMATMEKYFE
jgi:phage virion morphogenesis protein